MAPWVPAGANKARKRIFPDRLISGFPNLFFLYLCPPMKPSHLIADYNYPLPEERIARFPVAQRDQSKLLYYNKGVLINHIFNEIPAILPDNSLLIFNNTRVIPARLLFTKDTGALIEVFCLEPIDPANYEQCFAMVDSCIWKCTVGNLKRWKEGTLLYKNLPQGIILSAEIINRYEDHLHIRFSWTGGISFARVMEAGGAIPIPPYLKREATGDDSLRYQTVYARNKGSVAAPTAGLHFTENILNKLKNSEKVKLSEVTLHVGAGTFRPVKSEGIDGHIMHSEPFSISRETLELLVRHDGPLIAVGTTSTRTLESLYYLGLQCLSGQTPEHVAQWIPYESALPAHEKVDKMQVKAALQAIINYLDRNELPALYAATQIMIAPPYTFKLIDGLITNFHQPQSTLLLLIAALIGNDWHRIYDYALKNDYRFLSYGDSSLLIP